MKTAKEWATLLASKLSKDELYELREFLNTDYRDAFFDEITDEAIKVFPDAYFADNDAANDAAYNNTPINDEGVKALYADHQEGAFDLDEDCGRCKYTWGKHDGIDCYDEENGDQLLGTTFIPAGNE